METITKEGVYITPSEVIEYLYCPRFIYFMNCLSIPQHEEQRYKVLAGREIHEKKAKINKDYLRKKLNCNKREINVYLASDKYHLKGYSQNDIVDVLVNRGYFFHNQEYHTILKNNKPLYAKVKGSMISFPKSSGLGPSTMTNTRIMKANPVLFWERPCLEYQEIMEILYNFDQNRIHEISS